MKNIKQIAEMAKVSKTVIYKRVDRIDSDKPENHIYTFMKFDGKLKRVWKDQEVEEILNAALPAGGQFKVYREE